MDPELLAIKLRRDRFVILPEHVRADVAWEVVGGEFKRVDDARNDRLAWQWLILTVLPVDCRGREDGAEHSYLIR